MNIEEYRALKAQMEQEQQQQDSQGKVEQPNVETQQTTTVTTEPVVQTPPQTEPAQPTSGTENGAQAEPSQTTPAETPQVPDVIEIDGKPVPVEELKKGYLRQSDYTKKTQELARQRDAQKIQEQYFQALTSNPQLAEAFAKQFNLPLVDAKDLQLKELENKYHDLLLKQEVANLESRYEDFDAREVLQFAYDNKIENLEHAYMLVSQSKAASAPADANQAQTLDVAALTEQIRQQVLQELQSNVDTQSIIQSGGAEAPIVSNAPVLSEQEIKIARNLRMTPEEYAKWRNKK